MMARKNFANTPLVDSFLSAVVAALLLQAGAATLLAHHGWTGSALIFLGLAIVAGRMQAAGMLTWENLLRAPMDGILARRSLADSFFAAVLSSLFLLAGAANLAADYAWAGGALISVGLTILIGRLKSDGILTAERLTTLAVAILIVAFGVEMFTLYLHSHRGGVADFYTQEPAPAPGSGKYRGVILWQDVKPHQILIPPRPDVNPGISHSKDPLSIPFDGVYWYFKFPDHQPPKDSYTARGTPAATTFRSADAIPLQMEARQNFITPIDLNCCSRITVGILNADRNAGTLSIDLILANLGLPGEPSQSLGPQPVTSTPQPLGGDRFQAVPEVLSFLIPANPKIGKFDAATVRFIRQGKRGVSSAKISVEQFTLVPRGQ
jgi:hypothetical protein